MKLKILLIALLAILVLPLGAKSLKIAFVFEDLETEFWVAGHKSITQTLKKKGHKVIEMHSGSDANKQLELVKNAIVQGVDGIIVIPVDGQSAVSLVKVANKAKIPIGIFNRAVSKKSAKALVVVADNEVISYGATKFLIKKAKERYKKTGKKITPAIVVGDLADPNAVARRKGFFRAMNEDMSIFEKPIEIASKWDANVAFTNLKSALQANPEIDLLFLSSDFILPITKSVLQPLGKWKKSSEEGHVLLAGVDGDAGMCNMMRDGYVDSDGVQDLFGEAAMIMDAMLEAVEKEEKTPKKWLNDKGQVLTTDNFEEISKKVWGCIL